MSQESNTVPATLFVGGVEIVNSPILSAAEAARLLAFPSVEALRKAYETNRVRVRLFRMPDRKGKFALTADVVGWLQEFVPGLKVTTPDGREVSRAGLSEVLARANPMVELPPNR